MMLKVKSISYRCRTNMFFKEHKQYNNVVFGVCMLSFLILGAYTWSPVEQVTILPLACTDLIPFLPDNKQTLDILKSKAKTYPPFWNKNTINVGNNV